MSSESHPPLPAGPRSPARRRLWLWFLTGFLVVFVGLALGYPMYFYDGLTLRPVWLWQYYLLEFNQALHSTGALGPTSGSEAAALTTFGMHLALAALAGLVVAGLGWATQRRTSTV